jgi:site-specific DNA recombinase
MKKMIKDPNCKNKIYETSELEAIVFGEIRKLAVDPEYLERMYEAPTGEVDEAGAIEAEIRSLTGQISRYMDLYALDRLTLEEVDAKIGPLTDRRDLLEEELKREKRSKDMSREEVSKLVTSFGDVLDRGDLDEVRLVLTALIDKIVIDGEDVTIYWTFT